MQVTSAASALASMRSLTRSRYYIQCSPYEDLGEWSDARIWEELKLRLGPKAESHMVTGSSIEKSIVPLRKFRVVADAARPPVARRRCRALIVPPTGAKGT